MRLILLFIASLIVACSETAESVDEKPLTIDWEALLPEGEPEKIEELFDEYYANLDEEIQSQQTQSLFDAGREGGYADIPEGAALDFIPQIGTFNVVEELDGARVRIPGYVLPFEYTESGQISEFLLVPYFGACVHTPPPPNQIVYVTSEKPMALGDQWNAIWATGILRAKSNMNELGDAAYTLEFEMWESYDG